MDEILKNYQEYLTLNFLNKLIYPCFLTIFLIGSLRASLRQLFLTESQGRICDIVGDKMGKLEKLLEKLLRKFN